MKMSAKPLALRLFLGGLVCLLLVLQIRLWVSEDGIAEMSRLRQQVDFQKNENDQLAERNARLEAEVEDLKKGFGAVEERARSDLGLISPNESFFVFSHSAKSAQTTASDD
jgi:cell division protein FtsB